ncbi:MAG: GNAT family N-acetyltransferase [Bdellovibrionales bacterium]|nr:GNAT family N-acetyltransferase [Bdellovibrionales bacterium]
MYIYFEKARKTQDDAKLIMKWRNDPHTLEMFYDQTPKKWPSFWQEYQKDYFQKNALTPRFAKLEGKKVAFLRSSSYVDKKISGKVFDIDINLAKPYRNKGLSSVILEKFARIIFASGADTIVAEVKKTNLASIKAFERAGFVFFDEMTKHKHNKQFEIVRLMKKKTKKTTQYNKPHVFIIAEAGSNWRLGSPERDLAMAKNLIEIAKEAGADAVKFQTYKAQSVYVKNAGQANYLSAKGEKRDINQIFDDLSMPHTMIPELSKYANKCSIEFMSTPFSVHDFKALNPFVKRHKLASYEISHIRLIDVMAKSKKPILISTGGSTLDEIALAVARFLDQGGKGLTVMQCTAKYPAPLDSMNLNVIPLLKNTFACEVGLSDHSRDPIIAPVAAVALGATVIEKHFTIHNQLPGPDHPFAITPSELAKMVCAIRQTEETLGDGIKKPSSHEKELRSFAKRSIQAIAHIKKGQIFKEGKNIDILRPGLQKQGIHPNYIEEIEGKKAKRNIPLGDGIQLDDII